jgi:hypothetical protein
VRTLLGLGLVALLAAACGSGGGELSADQYQKKVSDLLVKTHASFQLDPGASLPGLVPQLDKGAQVYADARDELQKLKPPKELAAAHRQLLTALGGVRGALRRSAADARSGRTPQTLADLGKLATAENRLSKLLLRIDRLASA